MVCELFITCCMRGLPTSPPAAKRGFRTLAASRYRQRGSPTVFLAPLVVEVSAHHGALPAPAAAVELACAFCAFTLAICP